jgi:colanic acid biosynthesis glycosyl transferase WcaI
MARSAAHLFYDLGRHLVANGHQVTVVTEFPWRRLGSAEFLTQYKHRRYWLRETMDGINVIRVRGLPFQEDSLLGRGINALLLPFTFYLGVRSMDQHDVALVYCPPLTVGLAAFFLQRFKSIPFVFNVQDIYPQTLIDLGLMKNPLLIRFFEGMERFIYAKTACIVVHSDGNRQYLITKRSVPPEKVAVISNWADTELIRPLNQFNIFRKEYGIENKFIVCYAGTMGYAQDLNPFIQTAKELQTYTDILFLLVGEGVRENEWKRKIAQLALRNVLFLPLQPKTVYHSIVSASDVGLVPLTEELRTPVVPGKLLDFMAGGRPVIATVNTNSDTNRFIREANCGYSFLPEEGQQVTQTILKLYQDPSLAKHLGDNGRIYAEEHFSLKVCAAEYEKLFHRIIESATKDKKEER